MSNRRFSESSIDIIARLHGVTDAPQGYRQVSLALLSPSSSGEGNDVFIAMPEELHSIEALTFIGISKIAAYSILGRWTEYENDPDALQDEISAVLHIAYRRGKYRCVVTRARLGRSVEKFRDEQNE